MDGDRAPLCLRSFLAVSLQRQSGGGHKCEIAGAADVWFCRPFRVVDGPPFMDESRLGF